MRLNDRYDGGNDPFQGDRILQLRGLPVGARIERATAIVTPVSNAGGAEPFTETIRFSDRTGDWGATKTQVTGRWVEVDFHARRTLARVKGSNLQGATLQVDLGGAFVEINENGGVKTPSDPDPFDLKGNTDEPLPGLTVVKLKLTKSAAASVEPQISQAIIRSTPANVSLRFGGLPAFYTHVGDLVRAESTPDFTLALQAFLAEAKAENGFYVVPLTLHSDSIARLQIEFDVEFIAQEKVLPGGVNEVVLPFDFSRVANAEPGALQLEIPAGSRLVPRASGARVTGVFADTRIVYNPLEKVSAEGFVTAISPDDSNKADKIKVAPDAMQAQPISLDSDLAVTGIDLLLEVKQTTRLQLNLREDLDGKPGSASLLPKAVDFDVPGPVGLEEQTKADGRSKWTSVTLPAEFQFKAVDQTTRAKKRYWLVLQSVEGEALWSVAPTKDAPNLTEVAGMKRSGDGGLSWREASTLKLPGPLTAFFRLRRKPERFTMPIALQVGEGASAARAGLDRFAATGRVDFTLDFKDVNQALEKYLSGTAPTCREVEHLENGDFERWARVGDEAKPSAPIPVTVSPPDAAPGGAIPFDVVVAPDGAFVYVISDFNEAAYLHVIDAGCNKQVAELDLDDLNANRLVISPDGSRLYLPLGSDIQVVDTHARAELGDPFKIDEANVNTITALAVSPDGSRLFVATKLSDTPQSPGITWLDAAQLELAVTGINPGLAERKDVAVDAPSARVTDLATSPDGSRLYAPIDFGEFANGEVRAYDANTLAQIGPSIVVGGNPRAIALTPDGKHALVIKQAGDSVEMIDTATGTVITHIPLNGMAPVSIVVSSDGRQAYVGAWKGGSIIVIDLLSKRVSNQIALGLPPQRLAITPQGDRAYGAPALIPSPAYLVTLQIGAPQPEEWSLTSGQAARACLDEPFHQVALLAGETPSGNLAPATLSQVTPVTASCAYDFSFYGITTVNDAFAEVFWLGGECGAINPEPDRVPIEVLPPSIVASFKSDDDSDSVLTFADAVAAAPAPALHRQRLAAPAGSEQAEVRFNIPPGGFAWIDRVSLRGTTEAVANGDFKSQKDGRFTDWTLAPATAPGFTVVATPGGVRLQNAGANAVELAQRVSAEAEQPFLLEARTVTSTAPALSSGEARPRLEARWLDDGGNVTGSPASIEIQPAGLGAAIARGTSPAGATQAEIHLIIPPRVALEIKGVSLRFPRRTLVPITFVADAPGELTVSDWQVSYEEAPPERPPIPPRGLCPPTPSGRDPGEAPEERGFCHCCEAEREMADSEAMQTAAGRPVLVGHCVSCDSEMVRFGGEPVPDSPRFFGRGVITPRPFIIVPPRVVSETTARVAPPRAAPSPAELPPITAIKGIGERLAAALARRRIKTIADLAKASPQSVEKVKGISESQAAQFIAQAQKLLTAR